MANYLITSPSSETVGTNAADLFDLRSAQGTTIFGAEGNDTVSALDLSASAAKLNLGAGNDSITLTDAGELFQGSIFAGSGNDDITADALLSAAIIRGGSGNDTIDLVAGAGSNLNDSTVNGNDNADLLTAAILSGSDSSFIAAGKGKDTVDLIFSGANAFTINGGAGHDALDLSAAGSLSSFVINAGNGKDSIDFSAGAVAGFSANSLIDGGALGDLIRFGDNTNVEFGAGSATIAGGAGADTILFSAAVDMNEGFILGGDGQDSVKISATFTAGTLNGGAGADTITLSTYAISGDAGYVQGGAGADVFNLGDAGTLASGADVISGGTTLGYASFDESNLAAFDVASSTFDMAAGSGDATDNFELFTISQDVVTAVAENTIKNPASFTATNGVATFTSTFDNTLTARVVELDRLLGKGAAAAFTDGAGTSTYVFVQGGSAAGSGTDDDLLIQVTTAVTALAVAGNSAISVRAGI